MKTRPVLAMYFVTRTRDLIISRTVFLFLFAAALGATLALPAAAQTASFQGLGQMPGAVFGTYASAISGDGSTIMGYGWVSSSTVQAYRWTVVGKYQILDGPGGQ
jgi:hypothetical protein